MIFVAGGNNRPPRASYARIHHNYVYRPGREVRIRLRNRERAIKHIESLHGIADVDDLRVRNNIQDDALHRPHKVVVVAEVGSQSDGRTLRHSFLTNEDTIPQSSNLIAGLALRQDTEVISSG